MAGDRNVRDLHIWHPNRLPGRLGAWRDRDPLHGHRRDRRTKIWLLHGRRLELHVACRRPYLGPNGQLGAGRAPHVHMHGPTPRPCRHSRRPHAGRLSTLWPHARRSRRHGRPDWRRSGGEHRHHRRLGRAARASWIAAHARSTLCTDLRRGNGLRRRHPGHSYST